MDISRDFNIAFKDHQRGDVDNAEILYKKILKLEPNHLKTNFFLGTLFIQRKDFYLAEKKFLKVVLINPNHFDDHYN